MKKEIKVVAIVLAALIIFLSGFGIGATKGINVNVKYEGGSAPVVNQPDTQPSTQATQPSTQATQPSSQAPAGNDDTTKPADSKPADSGSSKVPGTPAEVVAAYNKAINDTKNYKGKVHFKKDSVVSLKITDCPGGDTVAGIIQPIVDNLAGSSVWESDYDNGVNAEGGNFYNAITPGDRDAALTTDAIKSATAVADGSGYKMTIVLNPETSKFDGTTTTDPKFHKQITNPLNLAEIDLGTDMVSITSADMAYAGATVEATVDGEGRITYFSLKMPIEGSGSGKIKFPPISATIGIAGSLDDVYTITYA